MLTGKTALVTHSTTGTGLAIARQLAAHGTHLILGGAGEPAAVEALRAGLAQEYGVHVRYDPADYADAGQSLAAIDQVLQEFGCVDILVNVAKFPARVYGERFSPAEWEAVLRQALSASLFAIREVLPAMEIKGWGRIVNIVAAHAPPFSRFQGAYSMARRGVTGLTRSLALEVAEQGITVNAVCPGQVWTAALQESLPALATMHGLTEQQVVDECLLRHQPHKKFISPEQVAALVAYLTSDAAEAINGAVIPVDGGWLAGRN